MSRAIPNEDEQEALDALATYMDIVWHRWGIIANQDEQTQAIHRLQDGVKQHMLHRLEPDTWGAWYTR